MGTSYSLEFAVKSTTELKAMDRLKALGISRADEAKLSDLDRQAGLFIIRVDIEEAELSDDVYKRLLGANDVFILSDELSAKRAKRIISLTTTIEQQLKKLLICVLPETEKVFNDIVNTHQKHKSELKPTNRIDWCKIINNFSLGELPRVLEEDISKFAKKQLLSSEGLLSLIISAEDFDALKKEITELSKPKIIWNSINSILEKPVEYSHISGSLKNLCLARNDAAHLKTITAKQLAKVEKDQKYVLSYIGETKSSYRESLQTNMRGLSESMKLFLDHAVKIDPLVVDEYQKRMSDIFKPVADTVSRFHVDITSPEFANAVKKNANYQSQLAKSFSDVIKNIKKTDEYKEIEQQFSETDFSNYMSNLNKEAAELKSDLEETVETKQKTESEK